MPNFSLMNDAELTAWVTNFTGVAGADPTEYELNAGQVTDIENINEDLKAKMTARVAAEEAARAVVAAQRTSGSFDN